MTSTIDRDADRELKARHRALWASGDYPAVAAELIPTLGPELVAACGIRRGQRVLDVGAGSGWTTALLAHLVGSTGSVLGLELEPELVEFGRANLGRTGQPWARIEPADPGVLGRPDEAPFDRILVSAEPRELPTALVDQLADDAVLVIPVAGTMLRVTHPGAVVTRHGGYRFVPLR